MYVSAKHNLNEIVFKIFTQWIPHTHFNNKTNCLDNFDLSSQNPATMVFFMSNYKVYIYYKVEIIEFFSPVSAGLYDFDCICKYALLC